MKTLEDYQRFVNELWVTPKAGEPILVAALGLAGEAGECADLLKKAYHSEGKLSADRKIKLLYELGDALYYIVKTGSLAGWTLEDIAEMNELKLRGRVANGTLGHEGR